MRADAQRNRERLIEAAREVFREQGYDASLDEVAKRAGVGAGTLYRHFPNRESLLDAIMQSWVDRVNDSADKVLVHEGTPRDLLLAWFEAYVALISLHKGGPAKITSAMGDSGSPIATKCQTLATATGRVVERLDVRARPARAHRAGADVPAGRWRRGRGRQRRPRPRRRTPSARGHRRRHARLSQSSQPSLPPHGRGGPGTCQGLQRLTCDGLPAGRGPRRRASVQVSGAPAGRLLPCHTPWTPSSSPRPTPTASNPGRSSG